MLQVGIPRETVSGERRVAATPDTVQRLMKLGFAVAVEQGAGIHAGHTDAAYAAVGARTVDGPGAWASDIILKVRPPSLDEAERLRAGQTLVSFVWPAQNTELVHALALSGATVIAMDAVPRISRAQKLDALSSMANIAGYRAVIEAAHAFPRLLAGQITAAGKMPPAKVLIIGAGVAGLAAIGAARGLGAVVRAFDTRPVVREQVQSMGAEFLEVTGVHEDGTGQGGYAKEMSQAFIDAEMALFRAQAKDVDIIITTALIPGKPAPKLILRDMVELMRPGSVVVDLAAEQGGNCELTSPGVRVDTAAGVAILGYTDLASRMAAQASQLYGTNLFHLLDDMTKPAAAGAERAFRVDFDDEVVRGATVVKDGQVTWPPPPRPTAQDGKPAAPAFASSPPSSSSSSTSSPSSSTSSPSSSTSSPSMSSMSSTSSTSSTSSSTQAQAAVELAPRPAAPLAPPKPKGHGSHAPAGAPSTWPLLAAGLVLVGMGSVAPPAFLGHLIVFVLACFVGYQVIWNVTPALHTPLMSVTNAISGIILVGGLLHASDGLTQRPASTLLGAVAILIATINIAGGFLVTQRMLKMFRRGDR